MAQLLLEAEPWLLRVRDRAGKVSDDWVAVPRQLHEQRLNHRSPCAAKEAVELAREHGPSNSCCDFLEHCRRYGATWRGVIEWVGELLVNLTLGAAY
jgi:hypothetical protein